MIAISGKAESMAMILGAKVSENENAVKPVNPDCKLVSNVYNSRPAVPR